MKTKVNPQRKAAARSSVPASRETPSDSAAERPEKKKREPARYIVRVHPPGSRIEELHCGIDPEEAIEIAKAEFEKRGHETWVLSLKTGITTFKASPAAEVKGGQR